MVAAVAAQVERPPPRAVHRVAQHLHRRREALERGRDDEVREGVEDAVDLDAAVRRVGEGGLEPLADLVALPDVGLEEDLPLRALDGRDHGVVEVRPEGVRRDLAVADRHGRGRLGGERHRAALAPPAVGVHQRHRDRDHERRGHHTQQGAAYDGDPPVGGWGAGHAATLPSRPGPFTGDRPTPRPAARPAPPVGTVRRASRTSAATVAAVAAPSPRSAGPGRCRRT